MRRIGCHSDPRSPVEAGVGGFQGSHASRHGTRPTGRPAARLALGCLVGAALVVGGIFTSSSAHLRHVGGSLLDLLVRSDGVVFARASEATRGAPTSDTPMRLVRSLAGKSPAVGFSLRNAASPVRYTKNQYAIVVLERDGEEWVSVQLTGEDLVFEDEKLDAPTAAWVAALWKATHDADPSGDLGALLRTGLRLPHEKLRALAALDLAELAHHQPGLTPATSEALRRDVEAGDLDPTVQAVLSRVVGTP